MRWRGRRESARVEDRRGGGTFRRRGTGSPLRIPVGRAGGGGLSLTTIVILVVVFFIMRALGIDPLQLLEGDGPIAERPTVQEPAAEDDASRFVRVILAETEDVWNEIFSAAGSAYREPSLVLFSGGVSSACGFASVAAGPFYCPGDSKVYLDLEFFATLASRFGASGDFAQAYVIAHEVGHHVQNLTGVLPRFSQMRGRMSEVEANAMSVRVELQADCYAGIWGHFTHQKGLLDEGDLEEALNAAVQIGDDTLQRRTQGYVVPDSFNHGTSEQRRRWFLRGFQSGDFEDCDTFAGDV